MVGKGIDFIGETLCSQWKLSESGVLNNGVICSIYKFRKRTYMLLCNTSSI